MRPSPRLIALVLVLLAASVLRIAAGPGHAPALLLIWGALVAVAGLDALLSLPARRIQVLAEAPASGFSGTEVALHLQLSARPRLPPVLDLVLTHDAGIDSPPAMGISAAGQALALDLPLLLRQRGPRRVTRLSLRYPSRLRLFEIIGNRPLDLTIACLPNIRPVLSGAIQAQMLPLLDGARLMRTRGEGSEFHQLRDFTPGMDPRSIDWKRSARARAMVARETRAERNHQIILCLDTGHLMAERLGDLSKLDHAINASLALAWAAGLGGDNVGFYSFAARPQPFLPPRPGRAAFGRIQGACVGLEQQAVESNHTLGLTTLNGKLKRRSLVMVFSDFVDSTTAELLVENLAVMQRQHLILYVALRDPALLALTRPAEDGLDAIARAVAANQILAERQAVLDKLNRLGILCLDASPGALTPALLSRYIEIKAKELI
ncbi:Uncharacterized conserved protein, DUF58 family, contains vWF domain [Paracoccus aminovorans]|uniref:Uncharacterized conserved protein, DUF58 family, contains vWF domain n=1 Tax=Paracoccus aminovorans TaxID=34004 RepID=A0A1I3DLN4_9RHOB|nr:DUF58 domain-containing protein [Paracoccus aminovorans]CQR83891.1 hypothetical protein JCM7685_pAMV1p0103 [Paracoccus aminovorans]SFH87630.1 Uncharacterized conserved protein, DUF58 family, contains vWF domain [Paracoccus aminovorans]